MAYITKSNATRMIKSSELITQKFEGSIYKNNIFFFNKLERHELLAYKALMEDPEKYMNDYYSPLELKDTNTFVFEKAGRKPSYHKNADCRFLNQDFKNIKIPKEIKEKGDIEVVLFRNWFIKELKGAYQRGATDVIIARIWHQYHIKAYESDFVQYDNSDVIDYTNYTLTELETKINDAIKSAGRYYYKHKEILQEYSTKTFLAYKSKEIPNNPTSLNDEELKSFLKDYDKNYKNPVKMMLKEWYRIHYNKDFSFEGNLLNALNFKPCKHCYEGSNTTELIAFTKTPFKETK